MFTATTVYWVLQLLFCITRELLQICVKCTNRSLLRWLKLWDHTVFGTELKVTTKNQSQANDPKLNKKDSFPANKKQADGVMNELLDDTNRPVQKVCLNLSIQIQPLAAI